MRQDPAPSSPVRLVASGVLCCSADQIARRNVLESLNRLRASVHLLRYDRLMFAHRPLLAAPRALLNVSLRPLGPSDVDDVKHLLSDLPVDYPGGDQWLARRLIDVLEGAAACTLATVSGRVVGVTIGTPKRRATKLSTIFVEPAFRRSGVGSRLLDAFLAEASPGAETYVTVADHKWRDLSPLLRSRGFVATALESDRYGPGRDEVVATLVAR